MFLRSIFLLAGKLLCGPLSEVSPSLSREYQQALLTRKVLFAARGERGGASEGISGPRFLGCRELTYRLSFLACSAQVRMPMHAAQSVLSTPVRSGIHDMCPTQSKECSSFDKTVGKGTRREQH